ncbi:MAG TPA: PQQ-dependent sugar dehydrogenase [Chthoniobacterales bacterium]
MGTSLHPLRSPVEMVSAPDASGRLFIVEQGGSIRVYKNGQLNEAFFLDDSQIIVGGEQGLLGLAFHPGFAEPASPGYRKVYTYTTRTPTGAEDFTVPMSGSPANDCVLTEWQVSAVNPDVVDTATQREILRIAHPEANHNGGKIAFSPRDGYLYIGIGDGGGANDIGDGHTPGLGNGQDTSNLLGKILRIDPLAPALTSSSADAISTNGNYRVPRTNPFVNGGGRAEIFAYGFRNPYRFSFDVQTGLLLVGDVGQNSIEEIDSVRVGQNYGWNRKEGSFLFDSATGAISPDPAPNPTYVEPVLEYDHRNGTDAVIGGFLYRGTAVTALEGKYVFADYLHRLFYADLASGSIQQMRIDSGALDTFVQGLATDVNGELYVLGSSGAGNLGGVSKIVPVTPKQALTNYSTRANVKTGDGVTIAGIIINGSAPKTVAIRALGPSLKFNGQPLPGRLANPFLELHDSAGAVIDSNDNWMTHPRAQELRNANRAPEDPLDAAIVATLDPGSYTAIMRGVNGANGIGLVELYDIDSSAPANAVNMSGRARVETGDNVTIGGFIVAGSNSQRVLVRGIGPSLTAFGVTDALENPMLDLYNASGTKLATNDNWRSDQAQEINDAGLAPNDDAEAALVRTFTPGAYTAVLSGVGNTTGIGLIEIYLLSP